MPPNCLCCDRRTSCAVFGRIFNQQSLRYGVRNCTFLFLTENDKQWLSVFQTFDDGSKQKVTYVTVTLRLSGGSPGQIRKHPVP